MNNRTNYTLLFDKFALKAFDYLSHNWATNRPVFGNYLLDLFNHYYLKANLKTINVIII